MTLEAAVAAYHSTVLSLGGMGALLLVQLFVVDVAGIRSKHAPGSPIEADPANFLFRAARAHANTNESIAAFVLLTLFAIGMGADPTWTNGASLVFLAARASHMICYWAGLGIARSASFGVAGIALTVLAATGLRALI